MATFKFKTPFCHLTYGPSVVIVKDGVVMDTYDPPPQLCRGSNCSAWERVWERQDVSGRCGLVKAGRPFPDPVPHGDKS